MNPKARKLILFAPLFFIGAMVFVAIGGAVVMLLWNALAPSLFGLPALSFWQALGILVLCRILFGGFGMRGESSHTRRRSGERLADRVADRMAERFASMSAEDRERLSRRIQERWGRSESGETTPL